MRSKIKRVAVFMATLMTLTAFKTRDQQNHDGMYRYFGNNRYEISNSTGIYLYRRYQSTEINKGKGEVMQLKYYFSKTEISEILPLSLENIDSVFCGNTRFRYLIESQFRNDDELTDFDKYLHVYKIEYLYSQS